MQFILGGYLMKVKKVVVHYLLNEKNNNQSVPKFAIDSFIECFRGYLDVIHIGEYAIIKKKKF